MNIVDTIDNFDINNIYFTPSFENNIIDNGIFSKMIYSTPSISLNGIYILVSFHYTTVEKNHYNKFKISWNEMNNKIICNKIKKIESSILNKYSKSNNSLILSSTLDNNTIRIFSENINLKSNTDFLLRISGVWDNGENCGITYKFLEMNGI
mgnify:CR=1 FL=1